MAEIRLAAFLFQQVRPGAMQPPAALALRTGRLTLPPHPAQTICISSMRYSEFGNEGKKSQGFKASGLELPDPFFE
jgi:hypothetical protein